MNILSKQYQLLVTIPYANNLQLYYSIAIECEQFLNRSISPKDRIKTVAITPG